MLEYQPPTRDDTLIFDPAQSQGSSILRVLFRDTVPRSAAVQLLHGDVIMADLPDVEV